MCVGLCYSLFKRLQSDVVQDDGEASAENNSVMITRRATDYRLSNASNIQIEDFHSYLQEW